MANSRRQAPNPYVFFGLFVLSSGLFYLVAKRTTHNTFLSSQANPKNLLSPQQPAFDKDKITVIYVLGGPGVGKGTQCSKLVEKFEFCHLSAGDLLRAEQDREGSQFGDLIKTCILEGTIVPMEVTIKLLENAMRAELARRNTGAWSDGKGRFLIDGFPRQMDQAQEFDKTVCPATHVIFYTAPEDVMVARLLERGKTSGRADDNVESIKKRLATYHDKTMPVVQYYELSNKVSKVRHL
ncbi:ADK-domain-containing protein [Coniophora puteana RWD-64-598 SS2]|uniref:ADK-domain-containing protein n=1 Tax=Coniophora puteana (strain RWD-64-598) TaxID=741705 RepID=A0A5M3N353_CONPW|nr:ADK-domain-containing protein [Coniophora puteana RWD-64-598 SS2]EIW85295.1 ADK-domain-containing protein [Coniophora puteana RWD-64-598 SS2]